jgi:hypothetical protein
MCVSVFVSVCVIVSFMYFIKILFAVINCSRLKYKLVSKQFLASRGHLCGQGFGSGM